MGTLKCLILIEVLRLNLTSRKVFNQGYIFINIKTEITYKNLFYRDKIIDWGKKNNLNIITWPDLPIHQDRQHYQFCNKIWKKIFCIELNDSVDLFLKLRIKINIFSN